MTPASGGTWGVPGFPIESILTGLVAGLVVLTVLRRRRIGRP
jgi:LytS/YehU family sensor histidine kinase